MDADDKAAMLAAIAGALGFRYEFLFSKGSVSVVWYP